MTRSATSDTLTKRRSAIGSSTTAPNVSSQWLNDDGPTVVAGNNVIITSSDQTKLLLITASLAGGYVGVGVAVGVATLSKDTEAFVGVNSTVDALANGSPQAGLYDGTFTGGGDFHTAEPGRRRDRGELERELLRPVGQRRRRLRRHRRRSRRDAPPCDDLRVRRQRRADQPAGHVQRIAVGDRRRPRRLPLAHHRRRHRGRLRGRGRRHRHRRRQLERVRVPRRRLQRHRNRRRHRGRPVEEERPDLRHQHRRRLRRRRRLGVGLVDRDPVVEQVQRHRGRHGPGHLGRAPRPGRVDLRNPVLHRRRGHGPQRSPLHGAGQQSEARRGRRSAHQRGAVEHHLQRGRRGDLRRQEVRRQGRWP